MKKALLLLLFVSVPGWTETKQEDKTWSPFSYFIGSWSGTGQGEPGTSEVEREYQFVMNSKYIHAKHKSIYKPQEKNLKGETHEDWNFFSYDRTRKAYILRQFHAEDFVNQYLMDAAAADGKVFTFTTESIENIPAGFRAREIIKILNQDEFVETFEIAEPGKDFAIYSENRFKRKVQ